MSDTPLIWTARGNVPLDSLTYEKGWRLERGDDGRQILWFEERWLFDDGTLAKNNAHGYGPIATSNDVTVGLTGAGIGGVQASVV